MSIFPLWPTNLLMERGTVTDEVLQDLINIGNEYELQHPEAHIPVTMRVSPEVSYNLLEDTRPSCQEFKALLTSRMKQLAAVEGYHNPDEIQFEAVTNLRRFGPMEYAKPHNHRSVDYVAVLFLSLKVTDTDEQINQGVAGNRLHLIDPIAMRPRFLNHRMLQAITPVPGMLVIHPASVYHTTEINISDEDLVALVTNIKVVDPVRNYVRL